TATHASVKAARAIHRLGLERLTQRICYLSIKDCLCTPDIPFVDHFNLLILVCIIARSGSLIEKPLPAYRSPAPCRRMSSLTAFRIRALDVVPSALAIASSTLMSERGNRT